MSPEELQRLATDARPRLAWRIGISGHRAFPDADPIALQKALEDVFADVERALKAVQDRKDAAAVFAPAPPVIALVSPLAEGADRLCAELAVRRGFELRVALPLPEAEYKRDFPGSVQAFDSLVAHAKGSGGVVELDGRYANDDERNCAYMAVGEFVLRNCDLLVAVWDGKAARGPGGTAEVVKRARQYGVPIVHVQSVDPHPIMIFESGAAAWQAYSPARLSESLANQIIPKVRGPRADTHEPHGCEHEERRDPSLHGAEIYFRREPLTDTAKAPDFLYEGPFVPQMPWPMRTLATIFPTFVNLLGKKPRVDGPVKNMPPCGPDERTARYLFLHHHRADALSTFYANLHRSAFMLVYVLGALALSCAVAAIKYHHLMYLFTGLELAALVLTVLLVELDNRSRWRDRWLEYRLLAELLREADLLAQIGRPMPIAKIDELAQDLPGRAWATIAYCAIIRRAGLVSTKFDTSFLTRVRDYAADTRLQDQIAYHLKAEARNDSIGHKLRRVGRILFGATMLVALLKLIWDVELKPLQLALLAGVLPAIAYALFGIRNQAEFEIVSRRSERMIVKLCRHKHRMKALDGDALTSEALGREILLAAAVMRHDAADWTSIFEVKETET